MATFRIRDNEYTSGQVEFTGCLWGIIGGALTFCFARWAWPWLGSALFEPCVRLTTIGQALIALVAAAFTRSAVLDFFVTETIKARKHLGLL